MTEAIGKNFPMQQPIFKAEVKAKSNEESPLRELSQDVVEKEASLSKEFGKNNEILFSAGIASIGHFGGKIGMAIDLNGDNMFAPASYANKEPVLAKPLIYGELKKYLSDAKKIDIITQDNIKELTNIDDIEIADMKLNHNKDSKVIGTNFTNKRSISSLINEVGAIGKNPKWGLNLGKDEFIIYEPKK